MSKNIIPLLIVLVVILIGGLAIYFIMNPKNIDTSGLNTNTNGNITTTPANSTTQNPQGTGQVSPTAVETSPTVTPVIINSKTFDDGLKIEDEKIGDGPEVKSGDNISINYLGTLENGQKFDSSYDRGQPFETQIGVGQVIKGWDEGVVGMKVGGKRRLTIPASLGYGAQAAGSIPANSTLIFEVELMGIK
jgi:peptidylprolyl isomerase